MAETYVVAWWNTENLFDTENADRPEKLKTMLASELKGWNDDVLQKKISQLATAVSKMNNGKGPDLLGVCEVENKHVVDLLSAEISRQTNRAYAVVHHDTSDERGIDVAFIFDGKRLEAGETLSHVILKRTATRDLYQVNFKLLPSKQDLVVVGNHWPARTAGVLESEPYRMIAGETLSYWVEQIQEEKGEDVALLAMGDFNDEPHCRAVTDYARAIRVRDKAAKKGSWLYNLMWPLMAKGVGSYYYDGVPNLLDQFMVSRGLLGDVVSIDAESVRIITEGLGKPNATEQPRPFGRGKSLDVDGHSDHFPISVKLTMR
jgi:hypothetical protein